MLGKQEEYQHADKYLQEHTTTARVGTLSQSEWEALSKNNFKLLFPYSKRKTNNFIIFSFIFSFRLSKRSSLKVNGLLVYSRRWLLD